MITIKRIIVSSVALDNISKSVRKHAKRVTKANTIY